MCGFDRQKGPGRLMAKGLTLIVVGHINFILGAIVHGSILRHISKPSGKISTEYTVSNIIAVTSGLLSIASGIVAILVSRNITTWKLVWLEGFQSTPELSCGAVELFFSGMMVHVGLLVSSFLNTLLSAACCVGLLLAISLTIKADGSVLMQGCNSTGMPINARSPINANCPFDTTRIYDTTLSLWFPCTLLSAMEAGLSMWCFIIGLALRGIGPCGHTYLKEQLEEEALASTSKRDPEFVAPSQRLIAHHSAHA